jgi:hypothetical protein
MRSAEREVDRDGEDQSQEREDGETTKKAQRIRRAVLLFVGRLDPIRETAEFTKLPILVRVENHIRTIEFDAVVVPATSTCDGKIGRIPVGILEKIRVQFDQRVGGIDPLHSARQRTTSYDEPPVPGGSLMLNVASTR